MRRKQRLIIFNIVAIGLLTIVGGILESLASTFIPKDYFAYVWPTLGVVALASIGFSVWLYRLQEDSEPLPPSAQNRQRMLEKVHAFWIKGVLENSLHNKALIALGLHKHPDAVENPWHLILQQPDQSMHALPAGTRITEVYDHAGGELLILGEPGSGKTTLLLELARDLLDRAGQDDTHPMPVILNLSSWAVKRQPIADWLVEELNDKYQVPRRIGRTWMSDDQLLPLLDRLDEVPPAYQAPCVEAINTYRQEHGLVPLVICSRRSDYFAQAARLLLYFA